MSVLMYCPHCKTSREVTKKGFDKYGDQMYICKTCYKKFNKSAGILPVPDIQKKSNIETTLISINNSLIIAKNEDLNLDQIIESISDYFKNFPREKLKIKEIDEMKIIKINL